VFGGGSLDGMTAYEESLVRPMFTPWAEFLLDRVHPSPGERLLDVATGPFARGPALTAAIASRLESLTETDGAVCSDLTSQIALAVA
jgi:hypothetical protein